MAIRAGVSGVAGQFVPTMAAWTGRGRLTARTTNGAKNKPENNFMDVRIMNDG
jgi:hypothetical protein